MHKIVRILYNIQTWGWRKKRMRRWGSGFGAGEQRSADSGSLPAEPLNTLYQPLPPHTTSTPSPPPKGLLSPTEWWPPLSKQSDLGARSRPTNHKD